MSSASRPTYFPAMGRESNTTIKSVATSAKDQTAHTKLKFRQVGQGTSDELRQRDFRAELEEKERKFLLEKDKSTAWMAKEESKVNIPLLLKNQPELNTKELEQFDDDDVVLNKNNSDSDGFDSSSDEGSNDDDDDDDDDEEDDEDELQAELERIREERAAAQAKKLAEEKALQDQQMREEALKSNPLATMVADDSTAKIKRRWNDDVIFRNQAKDEPERKKRFINDTVRSDFHRSFLKKFVK